MKYSVFFIIIAFLLAVIAFRECTRPDGGRPQTSDTLVIRKIIPGDSIPYEVIIEKEKPVPVYVDTGSTKWRDRPVDTMAILADYFSKYYYDDTLMNDTSAFIRILSHTFQNKLYHDKLFFQNRRAKAINTTYITQYNEKPRLYIGVGEGFNPEMFDFTADAMITLPNRFAFAYKRGINTKFNYFTIYYSFGRKKITKPQNLPRDGG